MTDETNLFDAPWEVNACCEIHNKNEELICICCPSDFHIANRLARLPELYDALVEAVNDACQDCVDETYECTGFLFDPANDGCIYPERDCCPKCRSWITLLEKVRDGE